MANQKNTEELDLSFFYLNESKSRRTQNIKSTRKINKRKSRKKQIRRRVMKLLFISASLIIAVTILINNKFLKIEEVAHVVDGVLQGVQQLESVLLEREQGIKKEIFDKHPEWTEDFLTISEYSRPGDSLNRVKNIFVHYTANPGTSAMQNRSYFEQLKDTKERGASAHFIIGYNGEILQIIPLNEMAYAVQTRNEDSISIECCYKAENGQFTQETYDSLINLLAWLLEAYELKEEDILRHYECGGKKCPLYYTENEDAWRILKRDVANKLK